MELQSYATRQTYAVLGIKPKVLCRLGKHLLTELHPVYMCMSVFPACLSVYHMGFRPHGSHKRTLDSLELGPLADQSVS